MNKFIFLIIGFLFLLVLPFSVLAIFEDSSIFTIRTSPSLSGGYVFLCRPISESSIDLNWLWQGGTPQTKPLNLYYSTSSATSTRRLIAPPPSLNTNQGSYKHTGLRPLTTYYYWLETNDSSISKQTSCLTPVGIPQDPSNLKVVTLGPTELYLTWKDNAVRPHDFVVERIKVTPASTTDLAVTVQSNNNVTISWKNLTNSQQYKSPFYHIIERSTDSNFNQSNTSSTFIYFPEDINYYNKTKVSYSYSQYNVPNGSYYYRVKGCSFIKTNYDDSGDSCGEAATVGPITVASSKPSRQGFIANFIQQITNWFSDLFKFKNKKASAQQQIEPTDDPVTEDILNTYFQQFRKTLSFETNPSVYRDSNLEPNTVYLYRVKAVYRSGGETAYSEEAAGKTLDSKGKTLAPTLLKVCVRNSLCAPVSAVDIVELPSLEPQCEKNADCRDVGTSRIFFEETR